MSLDGFEKRCVLILYTCRRWALPLVNTSCWFLRGYIALAYGRKCMGVAWFLILNGSLCIKGLDYMSCSQMLDIMSTHMSNHCLNAINNNDYTNALVRKSTVLLDLIILSRLGCVIMNRRGMQFMGAKKSSILQAKIKLCGCVCFQGCVCFHGFPHFASPIPILYSSHI